MTGYLFNNVYLSGAFAGLMIVDLILVVLMIYNRKPGTSVYSAAFDPGLLTETGVRVRGLCNIVTGILSFWAFDLGVIWILHALGWVS